MSNEIKEIKLKLENLKKNPKKNNKFENKKNIENKFKNINKKKIKKSKEPWNNMSLLSQTDKVNLLFFKLNFSNHRFYFYLFFFF